MKAVISRLAVNTPIVGASAAPTEPTVITNIPTLYAIRLLLSSAIGDHRREEHPMAIRTPALVMLRISGVVRSSSEISGVAISSDVDVEQTTRVFQETMNRIT